MRAIASAITCGSRLFLMATLPAATGIVPLIIVRTSSSLPERLEPTDHTSLASDRMSGSCVAARTSIEWPPLRVFRVKQDPGRAITAAQAAPSRGRLRYPGPGRGEADGGGQSIHGGAKPCGHLARVCIVAVVLAPGRAEGLETYRSRLILFSANDPQQQESQLTTPIPEVAFHSRIDKSPPG